MINFKKFPVLGLLCALVLSTSVAAEVKPPAQYGNAVLYSKRLCGKPIAKGGKLNCDAFTAAHRKLPFGTKIRVTNLKNDKSVIVKINDRGPYSKKDILDMTPTAARAIGLTVKNGRVKVRIDVLKN
jgi:rare lipoprotein A